MKYLKTLFVISAILTAVIINYNCSDQNQVTSPSVNSAGEMKAPPKHIIGDGVQESYTFFIENWALIVPDQGDTFSAWMQYKTIGCPNCWPNSPPQGPWYDSFTTPGSGDSYYDDNLMATVHWSTTYSNFDSGHWICETGHCDFMNCYEIMYQVDGVHSDMYPIAGNGTNCTTGHYTGSLSQRTSSYTLQNSHTYNVTYGTVEIEADARKNK